jgi:hypothetical protein
MRQIVVDEKKSYRKVQKMDEQMGARRIRRCLEVGKERSGALPQSRYNARVPIRMFREKCSEHGVRAVRVGDILTSHAGAVHLRIHECEVIHHVEILVVEPLEIVDDYATWAGWTVRKDRRVAGFRRRPMGQLRCRRNNVGIMVHREILEGVPRQCIIPRELLLHKVSIDTFMTRDNTNRRERTSLYHVYEFIQHTHCLTWKTERPPRDWRMDDIRPMSDHSFDEGFLARTGRQGWRLGEVGILQLLRLMPPSLQKRIRSR